MQAQQLLHNLLLKYPAPSSHIPDATTSGPSLVDMHCQKVACVPLNQPLCTTGTGGSYFFRVEG